MLYKRSDFRNRTRNVNSLVEREGIDGEDVVYKERFLFILLLGLIAIGLVFFGVRVVGFFIRGGSLLLGAEK